MPLDTHPSEPSSSDVEDSQPSVKSAAENIRHILSGSYETRSSYPAPLQYSNLPEMSSRDATESQPSTLNHTTTPDSSRSVDFFAISSGVMENELSVKNFRGYLLRALSKSAQRRGEHQAGETGKFQRKRLTELSWRGLINRLFEEKNVFITCECDGSIQKRTAGALIKHIQRRHVKNDNGGNIYFGIENFKILEA